MVRASALQALLESERLEWEAQELTIRAAAEKATARECAEEAVLMDLQSAGEAGGDEVGAIRASQQLFLLQAELRSVESQLEVVFKEETDFTEASKRRRGDAGGKNYIQSLQTQAAVATNRALMLEKSAREAKVAARHFELAAQVAWLNNTRVWMEAFPASDGALAAAQMVRLVADLAWAESELEAIKRGAGEHPSE